MPLFDYKCAYCDYVEEHIVRGDLDQFVAPLCPNGCKGSDQLASTLQRQFSGQVGFILRGPDFHKNSYDSIGPKDRD